MTSPRKRSRVRPGFTLVELLTVIGIISLLIGVLLPSLSRAREQAKRVKIAATLAAIGKGMEMFNNDFGDYPESRFRPDPILNWPPPSTGETPANGTRLYGAHWLARALVGHDFQGVDAEGRVLLDGSDPENQIDHADATDLPRKGTYLDGEVFARDDNRQRFKGSGSPDTRRAVVFDAYDFPILYYKANSRARTGCAPDSGAVYNQSDNAGLTGNDTSLSGWDFASAGEPGPGLPVHPMGQFGSWNPNNPDATHDPPVDGSGQPLKGKTFAAYLHSHATHETGGILKPVKPEQFILISAGKDGLYGTEDDVNNFENAL